jgi:hypothetical protein
MRQMHDRVSARPRIVLISMTPRASPISSRSSRPRSTRAARSFANGSAHGARSYRNWPTAVMCRRRLAARPPDHRQLLRRITLALLVAANNARYIAHFGTDD